MAIPAVDPRLLARMHQFGYPVDDQDERRKEEASEAELSAARAKKKASSIRQHTSAYVSIRVL